MLALAVLVCALALRLLVPAGWMPVTDASGIHLIPCSGSGPLEMPGHHAAMAGMAHHGPDGRDQGAPEHSCAFAPLGLAIAAPVVPAIAPIIPRIAALPGREASAVAIGRGLAAPPPPPTGPPVTA